MKLAIKPDTGTVAISQPEAPVSHSLAETSITPYNFWTMKPSIALNAHRAEIREIVKTHKKIQKPANESLRAFSCLSHLMIQTKAVGAIDGLSLNFISACQISKASCIRNQLLGEPPTTQSPHTSRNP